MAVDEAEVRAAITALEVVVTWHSGNQKVKVQRIVDSLKVAVGDAEAPAPVEPVGTPEAAEPVAPDTYSLTDYPPTT